MASEEQEKKRADNKAITADGAGRRAVAAKVEKDAAARREAERRASVPVRKRNDHGR